MPYDGYSIGTVQIQLFNFREIDSNNILNTFPFEIHNKNLDFVGRKVGFASNLLLA